MPLYWLAGCLGNSHLVISYLQIRTAVLTPKCGFAKRLFKQPGQNSCQIVWAVPNFCSTLAGLRGKAEV